MSFWQIVFFAVLAIMITIPNSYALTYQDKTYNFLIKYPNDWNYQKPSEIPLGDGTVLWLHPKDPKYNGLEINVRIDQGFTSDDYKQTCETMGHHGLMEGEGDYGRYCSNFKIDEKFLMIYGINARYDRYFETISSTQSQKNTTGIQATFHTKKGDFNIVTGMDLSVYPKFAESIDSIIKSFRTFDPQIALLTPKKQIASGISTEEIICHNDFVLIKNLSTGSPACVKEQTALKLVERDKWIIIE